MSSSAAVRGHSVAFELTVDRYEFSQTPADVDDANWLVGAARLVAGEQAL